MAQASSIFERRGPAPVLLGLLALLLWGQCAALLAPGTTRVPVAVKGQVTSLDSLGSTPAALYLTIHLRNDLSQPILVRAVSGTLRYGSRRYPFSATTVLRDTLLYPWTELRQPVTIPLRHLSTDSLAQLRAILQTGYPAGDVPAIQWQAIYSLRQMPGRTHKARITPYFPPLGMK